MIVTRADLEKWENEHLARYAVRSKGSKGRQYPEREPDYRTAFQRDRKSVV